MSGPCHPLGFESERQLKEFIKALSGGAIPGKFAYVGEAAASYNAHALTKEYGQVTRSVADEASLLQEVWGTEFDSINTFVDLGPGNGLHGVTLLQHLLSTANWLPSRYLAIDYSSCMAELAKQNMRRLIPGMQVGSILYDIETTFMQASLYRPNVFECIYLLLGNTIGNVESISRTIKGIRSLAGSGARLLIGCALFEEYRSAESLLKPYQMNTYKDCILHPLMMIGVPRHIVAFAVEFDSDSKIISTLIGFREDFQTKVLGESVVIKAGSIVRCSLSRRFLPGEIPVLLKQLNATVLGMTEDLSSGHGTYCVIL